MLSSKKKKTFTSHHSLLCSSAKVVGDVHFSGDFYLEGSVKGNIYADDASAKIIISEHALVEGDIHAPNVIVNGCVRGTIFSTKHLELAAKAVIEGTIHYHFIEMVKGSQLKGQMVYNGTDKSKQEEPPVELVAVAG